MTKKIGVSLRRELYDWAVAAHGTQWNPDECET
jgi:hypothetical protein